MDCSPIYAFGPDGFESLRLYELNQSTTPAWEAHEAALADYRAGRIDGDAYCDARAVYEAALADHEAALADYQAEADCAPIVAAFAQAFPPAPPAGLL